MLTETSLECILTPSKVEVPLPSSSKITRLRFVALWRMSLVSDISIIKVDRPLDISSKADEEINIRRTMPSM